MHPTTGMARRLLVPIAVTLLAVTGTAVGVVLAGAGGPHPSALSAQSDPVASSAAGARSTASAQSAPVASSTASARSTVGASPVVPLLGAGADADRAVPAAPAASTRSASPDPPKVAPLRGLHQADLLVVAPFSLSGHVLTAVSRQPGVTSADPIEAAKVL